MRTSRFVALTIFIAFLLGIVSAEKEPASGYLAISPQRAGAQASGDEAANLKYIDPSALKVNDLENLKWTGNPDIGALSTYLVGDPAKEGMYIALVKWPPHKMSRPHFHPNDRYITVLSGVWWVGTGRKFDPDHTIPIVAGTVVTHFGKHIHYDGTKGEGCLLEIVGMGPATMTRAEDK